MVADLLPLSAPDTGDWDGALRFEYHYDVLPGSVISRFIVRMHRFISHQTSWCQTYWRRGVVLERDGHGALVKADIEDGIITVAVAGGADERRAMLDLIRADFERIHETIPKLRVTEKVPIADHPGVLVDYQHLVRFSRMSERSFIPEGMDQHISVGPFSARSRRLAIGSGAKTLSRPRWRADSLGPTAIGLRGRPDTYRRPGTCRWWVVVVHTLEEHRARRIARRRS